MDIPHWFLTPAFVAAIAAIVGSLVPILIKAVKEWASGRASSNLEITFANGNKISIEGKSLNPNTVGQIIDALAAVKPKDPGDANE